MRKITPILLLTAAIGYSVYTREPGEQFATLFWNIMETETYFCIFYFFLVIPIILSGSLFGFIYGFCGLWAFTRWLPDTFIGHILFYSDQVLMAFIIITTNVVLILSPDLCVFYVFRSLFNDVDELLSSDLCDTTEFEPYRSPYEGETYEDDWM